MKLTYKNIIASLKILPLFILFFGTSEINLTSSDAIAQTRTQSQLARRLSSRSNIPRRGIKALPRRVRATAAAGTARLVAAGTTSLSGTVVHDVISNIPVANAEVKIGDVKTKTKPDGSFLLENITIGTEQVTVLLEVRPDLAPTSPFHYVFQDVTLKPVEKNELAKKVEVKFNFQLSNLGNFNVPNVAPNGIYVISSVGQAIVKTTFTARSFPIPTTANGAKILIDGVASPILFASSNQVKFIAPAVLAPGKHELVVIQDTGKPIFGRHIDSLDSAFSFLTRNEKRIGDAVAQNFPSMTDNSASNKLKRDLSEAGKDKPDIFIAYGTGLGTLRNSGSLPLVYFGESGEKKQLKVLYAGPIADSAGLDQINIEIPKNITVDSQSILSLCDAQGKNCTDGGTSPQFPYVYVD